MPEVSISDLPTELICRVLESAHVFSVVSALARTARLFYLTWRENVMLICNAVGPRSIANFADAERLLEMQDQAAEAVDPSQDLDGPEQKKSLARAKRLLHNARCASSAAQSWVDVCRIQNCFDRGEEEPHMRPSELARFEHAFYIVWTVGVMAVASPQLQEQTLAFLDKCSPRELCRLDEFATWAQNYNENEFVSVDLDLHDEVWKTGCELVSKRWWRYCERKTGLAVPDYTPLDFFAFFDATQRYLDLIPDD